MKKILAYAQKTFDVTGTVDQFLILGMESRKNRDLDEFVVDKNGKFRFPPLFKVFGPKVTELLEKLHQGGYEVNQTRYPDLGIKKLAVKAGIGKWGKNSLVIHPTFGPWLRFVVIEAHNFHFPLQSGPELPMHERCSNCSRCTELCPAKVIDNFRMLEKERCVAYLQLDKPTEKIARRCDVCLTACKPQRP